MRLLDSAPPIDKETRGRPSGHSARVESLKKHPGRWGLVETYKNPGTAATTAFNIRNGILRGFTPPGSFSSVSRGNQVWAMYMELGND